MDFNLIGNPRKFVDIACAMGEFVDGLTTMEAAGLAVEAVRNLAFDIGAPQTLTDVGAKKDVIQKMAEDGMKSGHLAVNPRQVTLEDVLKVFEAAF